MESIIEGIQAAILAGFPQPEMSALPGKATGKLRLSPEQILVIIHAAVLAEWALGQAARFQPPRLARGPGGRPLRYRDSSILLLAVIQAVWRKSYDQIIDPVASNPALAQALGFSAGTISKGWYWERRAALGVLPFLFFFLALVAQLIRLGIIQGAELIVDSTLLDAWYWQDPGATWQHYLGKSHRFGYKVHVVLCRENALPVFVLVTPAHVQDLLVGWLILLVSALLFGFRVWVVYADAGYFDRRTFWVVHDILHASVAIQYNLRRAGKKKLATLFFSEQYQRLVRKPRSAIERHFAWLKRYFGLQSFQGYSFQRVTQFVLLTYIAALTVALAAARYQRPELVRSRSMVLANL